MLYIKKYPEYLLLIIFSVIGIFSASSYGFGWDESEQRSIGLICYNYVFNNDLYYLKYESRDHGAIFELLLLFIEKITGLTSIKGIYVMRHFVTNLFFILSAFYFYKLIFLIYNNKKLAVLGFLLLVLHPTIYGHSFFNSKDLPFLSMLIICFYQFAIAFRDKKYLQFIWLALFSSFLINIRIMGLLFMSFVIFFLVLDLLVYRKEKSFIKKYILLIALYLFTTMICVIIAFPLLWHHPLQNMMWVFKNLSQYPWESSILFKGKLIPANTVGWDYIPTWFCINTPIIYLVLGFSGITLFILNSFKKLKNFDLKNIDKNNLLFILSFFMPVIVVIVLKSVLYDTWRHLFYIYPAFILLAIYFLNYCVSNKLNKIATSITIVALSSISYFIIANFPFHHVYFNQFISFRGNDFIRKNYEMDYWGLSFNKSLEAVLEIDSSDTLKISSDNPVIIANADMLSDNQKKRIVFVDSVYKSDYYIVGYRWHPQDYTADNLKEVQSIVVLGSKINTILKVTK